MKVKITKNVCAAGKILKKDSVHDVKPDLANALIETDHAEEHEEPKPQADQQQQQQQNSAQ